MLKYGIENTYKWPEIPLCMAISEYDTIERMDTLLPGALRGVQARLGSAVSFGDPSGFKIDKTGRYHAAATVPLNWAGREAASLVAVSLKQYDGTGKEGDYTLEKFREIGVDIPLDLFCLPQERPEILLPRRKNGVALEGMFPLFTVHDGRVRFHAACLDEIPLDDADAPTSLELAGVLGMGRIEFGNFLESQGNANPEVYLTVYGEDDEREGDPHAIVNAFQKPTTQVVGFVAVEDRESPLYGFLNTVGKRLRTPEQ